MKAGWLALALLLASAPAVARECGEGKVSGGPSANGDALESFECGLLARVSCRVAEDRDDGVPADVAARRTAEWLQRLNTTGSHRRANWRPYTEAAAVPVYRNPQRKAGPTYYRAAYSCGLALRLRDDGQAQQKLGKAFDEAADRCEREHAFTGKRTFPNQALRECLRRTVDELAPVSP